MEYRADFASEIEDAVIGAILLESDSILTAQTILKSEEAFYLEDNKAIYMACVELNREGKKIDIRTVTNKLRLSNELDSIGGAYVVAEKTAKVATSDNIANHCFILSEFWVRRKLRQKAAMIEAQLNENKDVFEIIEWDHAEMLRINEVSNVKEVSNIQELAPIALEEIQAAIKSRKEGITTTGIPSGMQSVDRITGGWQKGNLIIVAGRPAMGKTTFALQAAINAFKDHGKTVMFISLEMSEIELMKKIMANQSSVSSSALAKGLVSDQEFVKMYNETMKFTAEGKKFLITDNGSLTISQISSKCLQAKAKHGLDLVVIDYLQLIQSNDRKGNREQEIASISRGLKMLAKALNIPVIALSQLGRSVEQRGEKKPMLSDLRESGAIEQDADMVCFPFRPEYYGESECENAKGENISSRNYVELIIAKHRSGPVGSCDLACDLSTSKFYDPEQTYIEPLPEKTHDVLKGMTSRGFETESGEYLPF